MTTTMVLQTPKQSDSDNLLTDRWFLLPDKAVNHPVQLRLKADLSHVKNVVIAAGRRSFKTERFLKRYFIQQAIATNDRTLFLGAPTRQQSKEIFWKDVKALSPQIFIKKIQETELKIEYVNGTTLHVVGLKEFRRIQGGMAHLVGITEFQECDPGVYFESFEPMLNDTGGDLIVEGRPLGKNHLYDFYLRGLNGESGWGAYHWTAKEILSEEQIERAKANLSGPDYDREYDASFETAAGNPYHSYSDLNNQKHQYNPALPIIVACDFNATEKPMSWVIGQRVNVGGHDTTYWIKDFSHQYTHTKAMCDILTEHLKTIGHDCGLRFYGDFAGKHQTSNSSASDWQIIEGHFRNVGFSKFLKPCRSIRNSIAATNGQLCNALGIRRQFVDRESCKALVSDWQKCTWKDNSRELDDSDPLRGHAGRAVDYFNDYEYPVTEKSTMRAV